LVNEPSSKPAVLLQKGDHISHSLGVGLAGLELVAELDEIALILALSSDSRAFSLRICSSLCSIAYCRTLVSIVGCQLGPPEKVCGGQTDNELIPDQTETYGSSWGDLNI
jgi:hypothetical protein